MSVTNYNLWENWSPTWVSSYSGFSTLYNFFVSKLGGVDWSFDMSKLSFPTAVTDANYVLNTARFYTRSTRIATGTDIECYTNSAKITSKSDSYYTCAVRIPVGMYLRDQYQGTNTTLTDSDTLNSSYWYLVLSNNSNPFTVSGNSRVITVSRSPNEQYYYTSETTERTYTTTPSFSTVNASLISSFSNVFSASGVTALTSALLADGTYYFLSGFSGVPCFEDSWRCGYNGYCPAVVKCPFPLFDVTDTDNIVKYLKTGDDSGAIDPTDPIVVTEPKVEDFKTNYTVYITRVSDSQNMVKVFAYNEDYNENRGVLVHKYGLESDYTHSGSSITRTGSGQLPTVEFVAPRPTSTNSDQLQLQFVNLSDDTEGSPIVYLNVKYKASMATGCTTDACYFGISECSKEAITDGYKFTESTTSATVTVYFRAYTQDDLTDIYDSDYDAGEDEEDDTTGTDSSFLVGNGFNTFNITTAQFNTINSALWSTDWTSVFKSTTINPISCVISCKAIPFTATAGSLKDIIIANLNTGVSTNNVNPVKSFNCGSFSIPYVNGDFTDLKYIKIRVWLPFIGWVELPAEEVISRKAYSDVGISAITKTLKFKYLVDFITGDCRCIISVNDTERWYYDGNCGIDIPLTSDNHTNAVSNSLKSLGQTVASVGMLAGGVASGNAGGIISGGIGLINSAPNVVPTYNYSVSHSPSGYIEASMNKHIMIVLECPNVQLPTGYAKKFGRPCERNLTLGDLSGYTKTRDVNTSGINATAEEQALIKSLLDSGVYL